MSKPAGTDQPKIEHTKIEHTKGGSTTKDATDLGVAMKPADPNAPPRQGPEDALSKEPTRGDYSGRIGGDPHSTERIPDAKPGEPQVRVRKQKEASAE